MGCAFLIGNGDSVFPFRLAHATQHVIQKENPTTRAKAIPSELPVDLSTQTALGRHPGGLIIFADLSEDGIAVEW